MTLLELTFPILSAQLKNCIRLSNEFISARVEAKEIQALFDCWLQSQSGSQAWQPIETAPKDGTEILLFVDPKPQVGAWHPKAKDWIDQSWEYFFQGPGPTHWMPLPEAPEGGAK